MLYILGIGAAAPQTTITNDLLKELNPTLGGLPSDFISERRSIVDLQLLKTNKGASSKDALLGAQIAPTDLSFEAAKAALERTGVAPESLGVVIGECSTPIQTCPSEGQRVAGKFGLKTPSYDILGGSGSFIVHLDTLRRWREERVPEYVLALTCHTPTHAIDYADSTAGYYLGDGAAAYVLSTKHASGLKVIDSDYSVDAKSHNLAYIEAQGHVRIQQNYVQEFVLPNVQKALARLKDVYGSHFKSSYFIGPQFDGSVASQCAVEAGFSPSKILTMRGRNGDCLGATTPMILSDAWNQVEPGSMIFIAQSGFGHTSGYAVLERAA